MNVLSEDAHFIIMYEFSSSLSGYKIHNKISIRKEYDYDNQRKSSAITRRMERKN